MKNYWPNKLFTNFWKNSLSLLIISALIFNIVFPTLVFAITDEDTSSTSESDSIEIITGDALAGSTLESEINTNVTETNTSSSNSEEENSTSTTEEIIDTIPTTTEDILATTSTTTNDTDEDIYFSNITISSTNTATTTSFSTTTADTGNNNTENGNFITETGDAVAYVDLVNVVNTNIVNSAGLIDFIRDVLGYKNFDMRSTFSEIFDALSTAESTVPCGENICNTASLLIDLVNQANIYNDVSVSASTGNNTSNTGSGDIKTGDAYASTNIVNVANTNIIDSNYLLLVFNNFDDLAGSLILPNSDFFNSYFKQNQNGISSFEATNNASISNTVNTIANTGDNNISGTGTSTIETGNAVSTSHTDNLINQNFINSNSFSMLIRVQGTWSGDVFGLPEGMNWENTSDGIRLYYENEDGNIGNQNNSVAKITNDASITNKVQVYALTGNNQISNTNGNNNIETGEAYADSTIFNIANTNIVGSNWINLVFNIYGDWSGNIAFGQPDLWLGLSAQNGNQQVMRSGSDLSYTYTIFNRGDTTAKNVILENEFPLSSLNFSNTPTTTGTTTDGHNLWSIGDIKAGETKEITVNAKISNNFGTRGQSPLPLNANVYSNQPDANELDNKDSLLLYVGNKNKNDDKPKTSFPAKFVIEKSADKAYANAGDIINYTIKLKNNGGPIYDALLVDSLKDEAGKIITDQTWPLDTIKNGENITITYSITLPKNITRGIYTNTAQLVGLDGSPTKKHRVPYESKIVTYELNVGSVPEGEVLGLSTTSCSPYLTTYLRQHRNNDDAEVIKLQNFLRQYVTNNLIVSGVFDNNTRFAIEKFQQQHAKDILTPWNMTQSTGYVYYTTQKKINEIMCGGTIEFPLTPDQEKEINYFKQNNDKVNNLLYSFKKSNTNLSQNTATDNPVVTVIQKPFIDTSFLFPQRKLNNLYYKPLDKWIALFKHTKTAFLSE